MRDLSLWIVYGLFMEWLWITRAPNLSSSGVRIWPLARMERGFVRKSGAGDAGVVFLRLKSLGMFGWIL